MTQWSKELFFYRLERAQETLEDARILANSERWNACVNRLYYACFYAVSALPIKEGYSSSKHTGVRSLFNLHFVKTGVVRKELARIYNDLFERRQESDYTDFITFKESQIQPFIPQAEEFVERISILIHENKN